MFETGRVRQFASAVLQDERYAASVWRWTFGFLWVTTSLWHFFTAIPDLIRERHDADDYFGMAFVCALIGLVFALFFVGIPLRIAVNLWFPDRRRTKRKETIWCVAVFVILCWAWRSIKTSPLAFIG